MTEKVIDVTGLTKQFGSFTALNGLDLQVSRGEVHGFLGPNGSGKSTTIRVLLGLLRATKGRVRLFGEDPWNRPGLHQRLAYVPGDVTLWPGLSGGVCLDILARARGQEVEASTRNELVERFELDLTKKSRAYSKGNRQKVALISALESDVDLLILDEPTSGLDPLMERTFQDVVSDKVAAGTTVLLSSHIMAEVEALADRVSIIREGRTVSAGTLQDLRAHTHTKVRALTVKMVELTAIPVDRVQQRRTADGHEISFHVDSAQVSAAIQVLQAATLLSLTVEPPRLDELFFQEYDEASSAAESAN